MGVQYFNDDDFISGENVFKKAFKKIKAGVKSAYSDNSKITLDKTGVSVTNDTPQITVAPAQNQIQELIKNPVVLASIGIVALLILTKGKK